MRAVERRQASRLLTRTRPVRARERATIRATTCPLSRLARHHSIRSFTPTPHLFQHTNPQSQPNYHHHEVLHLCRYRPRWRRYRSTRHQPRREAGRRRRKWYSRRGPFRIRRRSRSRWMVSSTERNPLDELELTVRPFPTLPYPPSLAAVQCCCTSRHSPWRTRWLPGLAALLAAVQRPRVYQNSSWHVSLASPLTGILAIVDPLFIATVDLPSMLLHGPRQRWIRPTHPLHGTLFGPLLGNTKPYALPPSNPRPRYHGLHHHSFWGNCLGGGGAAAGPGGAAGAGGGNDAPFKPNGPTKRDVHVVSERQEGDGGAGILGGGLFGLGGGAGLGGCFAGNCLGGGGAAAGPGGAAGAGGGADSPFKPNGPN